MTVTGRALILGTAWLVALTGGAGATEDKAGKPATQPPGRTGTPAESLGAGGLTGSAATKDGARTGTPAPTRAPGSPAPGTTR
jgi:hypothetical protein